MIPRWRIRLPWVRAPAPRRGSDHIQEGRSLDHAPARQVLPRGARDLRLSPGIPGSRLSFRAPGGSPSREYRARDEGRGLREVALAELERDRAIDLLVYGHSHVAALERAPTGGVFANAGSWLDAPTYLRITPGEIELLEWREGSAEGHRLDVVDRLPPKALADT